MESFAAYPWQKNQWQLLTQQLARQRFPHALLLHGVKGIGKLDFTLALAHYLLCQNENKHNKQTPCNSCASCQLITAGYHPDLLLIHKESQIDELGDKDIFSAIKKLSLHKKTEEDSSTSHNINVSSVEQVHHFLLKKAHQAGYKLVIIFVAEAMNIHTVNALLKILEEPPERTVFLLISHHRNALPLTLVSRTWQLAMPVPNQKTALDWLKETQKNSPWEPAKAAYLLSLNDNAVLKVKQQLFIDHNQPDNLRNWFLQELQKIKTQPEQVNLAELATEMGKMDFNLLLDLWRIWIEDMIRYHFTQQTTYLADKINLDWYQQTLSTLSKPQSLLHFYTKLSQQANFVLDKINLNKTLVWHSLLISWLTLSH